MPPRDALLEHVCTRPHLNSYRRGTARFDRCDLHGICGLGRNALATDWGPFSLLTCYRDAAVRPRIVRGYPVCCREDVPVELVPWRCVAQSTAECHAAAHRGLHLPLAGSLHHLAPDLTALDRGKRYRVLRPGGAEGALRAHGFKNPWGKGHFGQLLKALPTSQRDTRQSGLKIFSKSSPRSLTKQRFTCYYGTSGVGTQRLWVYMHICGEQSGPRPACRLGEEEGWLELHKPHISGTPGLSTVRSAPMPDDHPHFLPFTIARRTLIAYREKRFLESTNIL